MANRIAEIHQLTDGNNWRHVPTKMNPADDGSRGLMPHEFMCNQHWVLGPDFLRGPAHSWPDNIAVDEPDDQEVKQKLWVGSTRVTANVYQRLIEDAPDLYSLRRRTAWIH